jgi:hypothetical protein
MTMINHHLRGIIISGKEKINIPSVIVVKGGEIKSKTKSYQRTQNKEYIHKRSKIFLLKFPSITKVLSDKSVSANTN